MNEARINRGAHSMLNERTSHEQGFLCDSMNARSMT